MDSDTLEKYGLDTKKGLMSCMNDEDFYRKMLGMFLKSDVFQRTEEAFNAKDYKRMFEHSHDMKGVSGNLGMTALYTAASALVEKLRVEVPDEAAIPQLFEEVKSAYENTCNGIHSIIGEK